GAATRSQISLSPGGPRRWTGPRAAYSLTHDTLAEVYLDTNAIGHLFDEERSDRAAQLRRDLKVAVRARRMRLLTSWWAVEELGPIAKSNWSLYRRITRYVVELAWPAVLLPTGALANAEIRARRRLRGDERFADRNLLARLASRMRTRSFVEPAGVEAHERARASVAANRSVRDAAWDH